MLEIKRARTWGREYEIFLDGAPVGRWRRHGWKSGGRAELAGVELDFRAGGWRRPFEMLENDVVRASAHRSGKVWNLTCDGFDGEIGRKSRFRRQFRLARGGKELGTFERTRFGRGLTAELGDVPVSAQVFSGLVVLTLWQREDAATTAAAASASGG